MASASAQPGQNDLVTQVLLRVHASNLPRYGLLKSIPDVYAVVSSVMIQGSKNGPVPEEHDNGLFLAPTGQKDSHGQEIMEWGRTEIIYHTKNPQWTQTFMLNYEYGSECFFYVQVFRLSGNEDSPISMGNCVCEIGDILGTRNSTKVKRLPKGGAVFFRLEPIRSEHRNMIFWFRFGATDLQYIKKGFNKKGLPDTVFEICKMHPTAPRNPWTTVYRSLRISESLDPIWDVGQIDLAVLCNGDLDQRVHLRVLEYRKNGSDVLLGICETTPRAILNTQRDFHEDDVEADQTANGFQLQKSLDTMELVGRLRVHLAQVIDNAEGGANITGSFYGGTNDIFADCDVISTPHRKESLRDLDDPYVVDLANLPKPMVSPAYFQDYVEDGCQLDFCVAIDFTSSNGDPRAPGTLHDQTDDTMNDYEESIQAIGNAVAAYSDQFCVWGFGAKFGGVTRHLFQCGASDTVQGVEGILEAYTSVFQSDLTMSGPTVFDEVLRAAAVRARKHQQSMGECLRYSVLLVITDGMTETIEETKRKLGVYSSVPLSVIFVGVGRADFTAMHHLCDSESGTRKNATFVNFRQHQHDPAALGKAALQHVPNQLVQYMLQQGIQPSRNSR